MRRYQNNNASLNFYVFGFRIAIVIVAYGGLAGDGAVLAFDYAGWKLLYQRHVMGSHNDCSPLGGNVVEASHYSLAGCRVEVSGRFVGKDDSWGIQQSACYHYSLLLAT